MKKNAVILFNLGGPDSIEAIQPFLYNLFKDPDIFKIPFGQDFFARFISKRRAPKVAEEYKLIGGKSPINEWTEKQRSSLQKLLNENGEQFDVITAMRYYHPLTEEAVKKVESGNYDKIIMLPLYPHCSIVTSGSSFNEWNRFYKGPSDKLVYIDKYYDHQLYIKAMNEKIDKSLLKFPEDIRKNVQLVFSAHGVPVSVIKKGDPYQEHIIEGMELIMKARNYSHEYSLCYQSKVGPVKWLEPATDNKIKELSEAGKKDLLIIPISFVSDHVETLFELDIEYREVADHAGIRNYFVMEGLNDSETFALALRDIVFNKLENK